MKHTLVIFLSFVLLPLYGQVNTDSLKNIWYKTDLPDSTRISSINKLAWEGFLFTQPDSAYHFAQLHYDFARERGLKQEMAVARNTQGTSFYMSGNYARAIDYFYQSLRIKEDLKDYKGIAATLNNIGMIYDDQGHHAKAIEHYTKAIENFQKINWKKEQDHQVLVASYHNLGSHYLDIKNYDQALEYFNKALKLTDETKFLRERAYTFSNMGHIYTDLKDPAKSLAYYEKAFEIAEKIGDENGVIDALINFSFFYSEQGKFQQAISYGTKAIKMAQKNNAIGQIKDAARGLYLSYKELGKYETALSMYELYNTARDSIQSEKNKEEVLRQEFKYAYERQAAADSIAFAATQEIQSLKIAEQQTQLHSEKTQRFLLYSILSLLVILSIVGYTGYRRKIEANKIIMQQKLKVENQRDKIAEQHALLEEKNSKITEFNNNLESLVAQRTAELENSLHQIHKYQFNLAHKIRAPFVTLVGLLNLIRDDRFDSNDNIRVLQALEDTSQKVSVVLQEISEELNKSEAARIK